MDFFSDISYANALDAFGSEDIDFFLKSFSRNAIRPIKLSKVGSSNSTTKSMSLFFVCLPAAYEPKSPIFLTANSL